MPSKLNQRLELITNIAIIIAAVLLGYFLIQKFIFSGSSKVQPQKEIEKGSKVNLTNIDWQANQKPVLIVTQKSCHFCTESMPFYKTLTRKASERGVKVIAVLPNSLEESNGYLKENGLQVQEVRQSPLGAVNAKVTPTLIFLNERGEVLTSWIGKLSPDREQEVVNDL